VALPRIQHEAQREQPAEKAEREKKLAAVKEAFSHTWRGYKEYAWMQDELRPVTAHVRNPFCGWAATLVDSLDTLWIMGFTDEFEEAVKAVNSIDFTTSRRDNIPLFETTIRYLGGLLGAYDISNGRYRSLLDKAVELAEILLAAFDTPNRMPVTYYYWKP
jgi:mannosyl-oligosaccharide alpha-1,2-mannosidase